MSGQFTVTVLVENNRVNEALRNEHGLSYHIANGKSTGLFDTGQTESVATNAEQLGIDLETLSWIALSHGHYDHGGGLPTVLGATDYTRLYMHPAALWPKFAVEEDGSQRDIGLSVNFDFLDNYAEEVIFNTRPQPIEANVLLTGEIPRKTSFEGIPKRFQTLDNEALHQDDFLDDQALLLETDKGLVVLLGCAHAGVVNTLLHIQTLTNNQPIYGLIGGMHLKGASQERIETTIDFIRSMEIPFIAPTHCTGPEAMEAFAKAFPNQFVPCMTGTKIEF